MGNGQAIFVPTALAAYASMVSHHWIDHTAFLPSVQGWELAPQVNTLPNASSQFLSCHVVFLVGKACCGPRIKGTCFHNVQQPLSKMSTNQCYLLSKPLTNKLLTMYSSGAFTGAKVYVYSGLT